MNNTKQSGTSSFKLQAQYMKTITPRKLLGLFLYLEATAQTEVVSQC